MRSDRVIVIGAGIGGLCAAAELAARGLDVLVLERHCAPGGKMRQVDVGGLPVDAGPTVFTMRWVFDALFERIGERLDEHLALRPVQVLARHAWDAGERLDLHADMDATVQAIGVFAGPAAGRGYRAFCQRARRVYRALEHPYLRAQRPSPWDLVRRAGVTGLPGLCGISPFSTLWNALGRHFADPRLRQLFARYATYCGSSPFLAPATLMLVAHVEQEGVWLVDGGMHRVARALEAAAQRRGARFRYGAAVGGLIVGGGRVTGVRLASGEPIDTDAVVFNGDVAALADGRLGVEARGAVPATPVTRRALSALTWAVLARTSGFPLLRHGVFFSPDYRAEFDDLFQHRRLPADPTVYVCAQDRGDPADTAPAGPERLLCLVNAPPTGDTGAPTPGEIASCEQRTFERLARCGLQVQRHEACQVRTTPADFERLFPSTGGSLYGTATHGWRASFSRPGARCALPGLYLAGGSVHPGPGVPTAALSGHLAASSLLQDRASTPRFLPAATPGGISTR